MSARRRLFDLSLPALVFLCQGISGDRTQSADPVPVVPPVQVEVSALGSPRGFAELGDKLSIAYSKCLRSIEVGGEALELRLPFGQNGERGAGEWEQIFFAWGRAEPGTAWMKIEEVLASEDFLAFAEALEAPGDKEIVFDLVARLWTVDGVGEDKDDDDEAADSHQSHDVTDWERFVKVLERGSALSASGVYDYLYCVARVGVDCAGFVYNILKEIARGLGADMDALLAQSLGIDTAQVPLMIGLWFFDPSAGFTEPVGDSICDLRPGDIFLFRGGSGGFSHSALILSINNKTGLIRYAQDTDWAPRPERGVHDSFILYDERNPYLSLRDPSVIWLQRIRAAFEGEDWPMWESDGERFRMEWPTGMSMVVRIKAFRELIEKDYPEYYSPILVF